MLVSELLLTDLYTHSNFGEGRGSVREVVDEAERHSLRRLAIVDRVGRETTWFQQLATEVKSVARLSSMEVLVGAETDLLDAHGTLDLPLGLREADFVVLAPRQLPMPDGVARARELARGLATLRWTTQDVMRALVDSMCRAIARQPQLVLANPFSLLSELQLDEQHLPDRAIDKLARTAALHGARLMVSERFRSPSMRVAERFVRARVPIVAGSDARVVSEIAGYHYVARLLKRLSNA